MAMGKHDHEEITKIKSKKKTNRKHGTGKMVLLLFAVIVLFTGMVGSSLAWLTSKTEPVVNTFTYGDINIGLAETDTGLDNDSDANTNDYKMVPGQIITKDPIVTVNKGSEACWLFIKMEHSANFFDFIEEYELAKDDRNNDIWTLLKEDGNTSIYYCTVDAIPEDAQDDLTFKVIENDTLTVKNVSKQQLTSLTNQTYPKLTITAYAVQRNAQIEAINTAAEAWALAEAESSED